MALLAAVFVGRWLGWAGLFCVVAALGVPVAALVVALAQDPGQVWLFLGDPRALDAWKTSVVLAVGSAGVACALAVPLAVVSQRTDIPGGRALSTLARLPLALPGYLLAMAYMRLWAPKSGLMEALTLHWDVATPWGCTLILGLVGLPVVLVPLEAALCSVDPALEEAARIHGAGVVRALWDASLRPAIPSLVTGASLAASSSLAAFGVPLLLGSAGTTPFSVLSTMLYEMILMGTPSARARAVATAVWLAVTSLAATGASALAARRVARAAQGKPHRPRQMPLGAARWPLGALAWGLMVVLLLAPLAALMLSSLLPHAGASLAELTLHAHSQLWSRRGLPQALLRSVALAVGAGVLCVVAALVLSVRAQRHRQRAAQAAAALVAWPYVLPGSVLALALLAAWARPVSLVLAERLTFTLTLAASTWLLLLAYVLKYAALAVRPIRVALSSLGPVLDEAARMAGAGPLRAFLTGTAQALRPVMMGCLMTVGLLCFSELTMSVLLVGPNTEVVGTVLFELHSYAAPSESAALATWMSLLALAGFLWTARRSNAPGV